jgi:hypothetical protein
MRKTDKKSALIDDQSAIANITLIPCKIRPYYV